MPVRTPITPAASTPANPTPFTLKTTMGPTPMDIDSNRRRSETRTCYNCGKQGHISPQCPEPRKERVRANITDTALAELVAESVEAALKARDAAGKGTSSTADKKGDSDF